MICWVYVDDNFKVNEFLYCWVDIEDVVNVYLCVLDRVEELKFGWYIISVMFFFLLDDLVGLCKDVLVVVECYVEFGFVYE